MCTVKTNYLQAFLIHTVGLLNQISLSDDTETSETNVKQIFSLIITSA